MVPPRAQDVERRAVEQRHDRAGEGAEERAAIRMPAKLRIWLRARQTTISANDWIESRRRVRPSRSFSMPQAVALNVPMSDEIITTMPICVPVRPMSLR